MFPEQRSYLDPQAIKLLAALKFDPGYLLLCDLLQAKFDNLTDSLAENKATNSADLAELQYWRAFREILHTLKSEPENFSTLAEAEGLKEEGEPLTENTDWARYRPTPERLRSIFESQLKPASLK